MLNDCVFIPNKGTNLFNALYKDLGYSIARSVFLRANNPAFINDFRKTLSFDTEGIPTYDSVMNNPFIKNFIGIKKRIDILEKNYPPVKDTRDNYSKLLNDAYNFNINNQQNNDLIATIAYKENNMIGLSFELRNQETSEKFKEQYGVYNLNKKIVEILHSLGVTIDNLSEAETNAGRVGVTDFTKAREFAESLASLIKVANNMEGEYALSEEFSHLLIGIFRNEPLVQRAISSLLDHPEFIKNILDKDFEDVFNFNNKNMEKTAEEALGHILQKNLLKSVELIETPAPSLFKRLYTWVKGKFKKMNEEDVYNAIDSVDSMMSVLAKDILSGTRKINREDIKNSQREVVFNALSDRIERNIEILKDAAKTETKKYKISSDQNKQVYKENLELLKKYTKEDADTAEGLLRYSLIALNQLRSLENSFNNIDSLTLTDKFKFLRSVRMYTQSYGSFIDKMHKAMIEESDEEDNIFFKEFVIEMDQKIKLSEILTQLDSLSKDLTMRFNKVAIPSFISFIKPIMGDEFIVPFGKKAGTKLTIEDLVKEAQNDISFFDMWLQSMGDSADILLQGFDAIVSQAKTKTREESIDFINKVHKFREKAEKMSITDFDWMFETDSDGKKSGNYISEINYAQFHKDFNDKMIELDEKYGKNPTKEKAVQKLQEKRDWLTNHALKIFGEPQPNPSVYRNEAYYNLTDNQKLILSEFLELKSMCDRMLPETRVDKNKAIQIRKKGIERFWESTTSPSTLYSNIKEAVKNTFLDAEDDDTIFGEKVKKGLMDFSGNEFLTLPVLYTTRLKNPEEITTDIIGSLMTYGYAAFNYKNLDEIVDGLEVGKILVTDSDPSIRRKVYESRGTTSLVESINVLGSNESVKITQNKSYIAEKLQSFMESQVYHRYLKDQGTFFGTQINKNKLVSFILKGSALAQLGFNFLANSANIMTGHCMQNIEAAAGQYFNMKDLLSADKKYMKELMKIVSEANNRNKTSKIGLIFELFNVKQDFEKSTKRMQTRNWLKRIFGENIAFIGQEMGDHWLYGRTAIAMIQRKKVLYNGKKMSLWDALKVENIEGSDSIKQLNYREIKELDGSDLNIHKISKEIAHINQRCFGIYNDEDANAANRVALGRLLMQYRKWMTVQYSARFRQVRYNMNTESWEEGYYRTLMRFLNELKRGEFQLSAVWNQMSDTEKFNIKRALFELVQCFGVWILANWIDWPDDKDRPYSVKLAEYSCKRLAHELGGLTPIVVGPKQNNGFGITFSMPQELLKTVTNPIPATTVVQNGINFIESILSPSDYLNTISSGPYKDMSIFEKNFIKAPLPVVAQIKQIDKFTGGIDQSILYYVRSN